MDTISDALCGTPWERLTNRDSVDLTIYTDSQTLSGPCIVLSCTTERRLLIDLALIREAYESGDITSLVWISSSTNPADDLTKTEKSCGVGWCNVLRS